MLEYIIKHRLKWERILILNVKPSFMTPLYELLIEKVRELQLCVQSKEVDRSLNLNQETFFTESWFRENQPAIITIGDKHGQLEIISQLANYMKSSNYTIPILTDDFVDDFLTFAYDTPNNFYCFKEFKILQY